MIFHSNLIFITKTLNLKYTIVYLSLLCKLSYNISLLNIFTIVNENME